METYKSEEQVEWWDADQDCIYPDSGKGRAEISQDGYLGYQDDPTVSMTSRGVIRSHLQKIVSFLTKFVEISKTLYCLVQWKACILARGIL